MTRHTLGLKLWSTNEQYIDEAVRLSRDERYDYIELFIVPDTFDMHSRTWSRLKIPFVIHAPHFDKGLNLARKVQYDSNMALADEALRYADTLGSPMIIFHPGIEGDIAETARQLNTISDPRILIENKPHFGFNRVICNGSSPEEIDFVMREAHVGFCLDIGHAICSANVKGRYPMEYLKKFIDLGPAMYHFTDGLYDGIEDRHDHFGKGNYPLKEILALLPGKSTITIETIKDSPSDLKDFEKDINFIKSIV